MGLSNYIPSSRLAQAGVCTSTTRPASPYEGQMIYETDTNRVLVYDASAWVMIADTDTPPGMELVKTQTVGSAVSSVTVSDVFSSTYDNYKIIYSGGTGSQNIDIGMTLGSTDTNYSYSLFYIASPYTSISQLTNTSTTKWIYAGGMTTNGGGIEMEIFAPNLAKYTYMRNTYLRDDVLAATGTGAQKSTTQFTSFSIAPFAGTLTGGTIRVYGYRN